MNKNDKSISGPGTIIGANVHLVGALRDANDIAIHGSVEGEIICERSITIGETAQVKGPVSGALITIAGTVKGTIEASGRLEILQTGKVIGDIIAKDLIIRSGAHFMGKSTMSADESSASDNEIGPGHQATKDEEKAEYEVE